MALDVLQNSAIVHADGLAGQNKFHIEHLRSGHIDFIKVRMIQFPGQRLNLQLFNERQFFNFWTPSSIISLIKAASFFLLQF